jgi:hypothetical protein
METKISETKSFENPEIKCVSMAMLSFRMHASNTIIKLLVDNGISEKSALDVTPYIVYGAPNGIDAFIKFIKNVFVTQNMDVVMKYNVTKYSSEIASSFGLVVSCDAQFKNLDYLLRIKRAMLKTLIDDCKKKGSCIVFIHIVEQGIAGLCTVAIDRKYFELYSSIDPVITQHRKQVEKIMADNKDMVFCFDYAENKTSSSVGTGITAFYDVGNFIQDASEMVGQFFDLRSNDSALR